MKVKKLSEHELMFEPGAYDREDSYTWVYVIMAFCTLVIVFHYTLEPYVLAHFGV